MPVFIVVIVLGAIFAGFATVTVIVTEAVGVLGAIVASAANRRLGFGLTLSCCSRPSPCGCRASCSRAEE
jgi:TRAP-type mannitol/chloroaromatic compound transport system permease large subunit